ncbi:hypothetical protein FOA52_012476 [Chlamydomonas sp. UWO 241]|nr:hypothetical protein FOA52_012476 [Chlamydomonas sp. UWO 241]
MAEEAVMATNVAAFERELIGGIGSIEATYRATAASLEASMREYVARQRALVEEAVARKVGSISGAISTDSRASPVAYRAPPFPATRPTSPFAQGQYLGSGSTVGVHAAASTPAKDAAHRGCGPHLGTPTTPAWGVEDSVPVRTPTYRAASVSPPMTATTSTEAATPSRLQLSPGQVRALSRSSTLTERQTAAAARRAVTPDDASRARQPLGRDALMSLQRKVSFHPESDVGSCSAVASSSADRSGSLVATGKLQPSSSHANSDYDAPLRGAAAMPRPPAPTDSLSSSPSFKAMMNHGQQHAAKPWAHTRESTARSDVTPTTNSALTASGTDWWGATEHSSPNRPDFDISACQPHTSRAPSSRDLGGFDPQGFDLDGSMADPGHCHPVYQRTPLRGAQFLGLRHSMAVQGLHRAEPRVLDMLLPFYDRAETEVEAGV